jgi:hypothetical protein
MNCEPGRASHELGQRHGDPEQYPALFAKVSPTKLKLLAFTDERLEYSSGDELDVRVKS